MHPKTKLLIPLWIQILLDHFGPEPLLSQLQPHVQITQPIRIRRWQVLCFDHTNHKLHYHVQELKREPESRILGNKSQLFKPPRKLRSTLERSSKRVMQFMKKL